MAMAALAEEILPSHWLWSQVGLTTREPGEDSTVCYEKLLRDLEHLRIC